MRARVFDSGPFVTVLRSRPVHQVWQRGDTLGEPAFLFFSFVFVFASNGLNHGTVAKAKHNAALYPGCVHAAGMTAQGLNELCWV